MTVPCSTSGPSRGNPAKLYKVLTAGPAASDGAPGAPGRSLRALAVGLDPSEAAGAYVTPNGFLVVPAVLARTGVIDFGRGERYHVPEAALLSDNALRNWSAQIVTDEHPEFGLVAVTSDNARWYAVGFVQNARKVMAQPEEGGAEIPHLAADLVITDQYTISAIRAGKRQLSIGAFFTPQASDPSATYDWDVLAVEPNHVAVVDRGKCGASCKIALSAATFPPHPEHDNRNEAQRLQALSENARRFIRAPGAPVQAQGETMTVKTCTCGGGAGADAAKTLAERDSEIASLKLRVATAEKAAEENRAKAETATAQLAASQAGEAARIDARIALLTQARDVCGPEYAPAVGASDLSVRADMVAAVLPAVAETVRKAAAENNAAYVTAAFDTAMASRSNRESVAQTLSAAGAAAGGSAMDNMLSLDAMRLALITGAGR